MYTYTIHTLSESSTCVSKHLTWAPFLHNRMTSRKQHNQQYIGEVVRNQRVLDMFKALDLAQDRDAGSVSHHYMTALMRAFEHSEHSFSSSSDIIHLGVLQHGQSAADSMFNRKLAQRSMQLRSQCPDTEYLPHRLREFILGEQVGYGAAYRATSLPQLPEDLTIRVYKSAVLAADCPWDDESFLLQTVRANPSFHSKPFYDAVAVWQAGDDEEEAAAAAARVSSRNSSSSRPRRRVKGRSDSSSHQRRVVAYAKLLLLFSVQMPQATRSAAGATTAASTEATTDGGTEIAEGQQTKSRKSKDQGSQLALVQWYRVVGSNDKLCQSGAVALQADMVRDPARGGAVVPRCGIINLSSIIRREYIVQDYKTAAGAPRYHVSPFVYS